MVTTGEADLHRFPFSLLELSQLRCRNIRVGSDISVGKQVANIIMG